MHIITYTRSYNITLANFKYPCSWDAHITNSGNVGDV